MTRKILDAMMRFFTQNLGLKFGALIIAFFLVGYVKFSGSMTREFPGSLSLGIKNSPSGLVALYNTEQRVKVKLRAPHEVWSRPLRKDDLEAYIDLSDLGEGTHVLAVNVAVKLPEAIVVETDPDTILVRLEPLVQTDVPVKVAFQGKAKDGFVHGDPIIEPDKIQIEGAKSAIEEISHVEARLELSGESRDFQKRVRLSLPSEAEKETDILLVPKSVNVSVPIVPASGSKTVGVKVRIKGQPNPDYYIARIAVIPAVVEVSSTVGALPSILNIETTEIDIQGLEGNLEQEVELLAPSGIILKEKRARVRISLTPNTAERQMIASPDYQLSPGLRVVSIEPVRVIVSGPAKIIRGLTPDKVIITFDLTKKEAGAHQVNIERSMIALPDDCIAVSWLPSEVTIVLRESAANRRLSR